MMSSVINNGLWSSCQIIQCAGWLYWGRTWVRPVSHCGFGCQSLWVWLSDIVGLVVSHCGSGCQSLWVWLSVVVGLVVSRRGSGCQSFSVWLSMTITVNSDVEHWSSSFLTVGSGNVYFMGIFYVSSTEMLALLGETFLGLPNDIKCNMESFYELIFLLLMLWQNFNP